MKLTLGTFRLSPRPRYIIYDEEFNPNLNPNADPTDPGKCGSGGDEGCSSPIKNWELIFKVRCLGNGDIKAATNAYLALQEFLADICTSNPEEYFKQIKDETPLTHIISSGYMRPIDIDLEYACEAIKTAEVHLFSLEEGDIPTIASIDYTVNKPVG